jgi:glycosyltransferase involved in cell wall biosynthesis
MDSGDLWQIAGKMRFGARVRAMPTVVDRETKHQAGSALRIAFVHQPWNAVAPPVDNADSIALWTDHVARCLRQDHAVVCYSRRGPHQAMSAVLDGIEYRRIGSGYDSYLRYGRALDEFGLLPPERSFFGSPWYFRHYGRQIARDLQLVGADVVHIHNFSQFVPWIKRSNPRTKVVLHMHADWLIELDRRWLRPRLAAADAIVCCSDYFASGIREVWPEFASRVHVVYNGIDPKELAGSGEGSPRPRASRRILFVGRVIPDKGVHILIEAFNRLIEELPHAELTIVGPVPLLQRASFAIHTSKEAMVRELAQFGGAPFEGYIRSRLTPAAAERVTITGEVPRTELLRRYHDSDLLVLPSIYPEGFGIPLVEAACCELPAVATRRGGMPEVVIDGETGRLVEAGDAAGLCAAIADLLRDDARRRSMGQAARARALDLFTWDRITLHLERVYKGLYSPASQSGNEGKISTARRKGELR